MSLSEQNKSCIRGLIKINEADVLRTGPARTIDMLIDTDPVGHGLSVAVAKPSSTLPVCLA